MIVGGYKLNSYNATYEKTSFDVRKGTNADNNSVLEITDINSGITFIFEDDPEEHRKNRRNKGKRNHRK